MGQVTFLFGIHNHQPVGNFEWVFEDALNQCYGPFLEVLSRHPGVRLGLHHTGPLLEWIEANRPKYFETLKTLVDRNQVELLGGGFYEPLISTLPERDAKGQIDMMTQYLQKTFGTKPRGMWLAERVWEPQLASIINDSGMEYTLLDDTHFYYAGLEAHDMYGYYTTEDKGKTLSVFPINKNLRYLIPFNTPEKTIEYLGSIATDSPGRGVILGDDGEKFGLWPGTYHWVFEERYLDRLFSLLEENSHWIKMMTFSEYMSQHKSMGRIYLPNASYEEMMEWSLPTRAQKQYGNSVQKLKDQGHYENLRPYIRGGFWRNFFSKYPESNLMHKKMIYVSNLVDRMSDKDPEKKNAQRELWRGQCNCPYWHGLFGGLYLNYLRHANYSHLIESEIIALNALVKKTEDVHIEKLDYNCDGQEEIIVSTQKLNLYIQPSYGGSIAELDYRPKLFNLTNVLSRREESYHDKIAQAQKEKNESGQPKSIHDMAAVKEPGLDQLLFYDWYTRYSLLDHILRSGTTVDSFYKCQYREEGDFVNQEYNVEKIEKTSQSTAIILKREGHIFQEGRAPQPLIIQKKFIINAKSSESVKIQYAITNPENRSVDIWFGTEFNLTLLAGHDKKRYYTFNSQNTHIQLSSQDELTSCQSLQMVNDEDKFKVAIAVDPKATLWYFPLETISQSESGVEKTYQGSCLLWLWKMSIMPLQSWTADIDFSVS